MASPKYKLIYLSFMGLAEPIRLLFALAGVEYEDERIPEKDYETEKQKMPWGSVPVLYEDDRVLCQSLAILRYLGKKFSIADLTDFETAKCDEYVDAMSDIKDEVVKAFFEKDEIKKAEMDKRLKEIVMPPFLDKISKILKENGTGVLVGKELTYADLYVGHMLSRMQSDLPNHPEIMKHRDIVFSNPRIKDYVEKRPVTEM